MSDEARLGPPEPRGLPPDRGAGSTVVYFAPGHTDVGFGTTTRMESSKHSDCLIGGTPFLAEKRAAERADRSPPPLGSSPWPTNRAPRCALRSDYTNGTSIRRKLLLLNELRPLAGDRFGNIVYMSNSILSFGASGFRINDIVLNLELVDDTVPILGVSLEML
jgi:hypothetical protein